MEASATFEMPVQSRNRRCAPLGNRSGETLADFIAHLFAESLPVGRPFPLIDVPAIEDVEIFEDRMAIAGHRQDEKEFACGSAGAGDLPSAYGVGTVARLKPAELCHIGGGQWPADRVTEILAKLFQFRACHGDIPGLEGEVEVPA
jgi:hypothetical protein